MDAAAGGPKRNAPPTRRSDLGPDLRDAFLREERVLSIMMALALSYVKDENSQTFIDSAYGTSPVALSRRPGRRAAFHPGGGPRAHRPARPVPADPPTRAGGGPGSGRTYDPPGDGHRGRADPGGPRPPHPVRGRPGHR